MKTTVSSLIIHKNMILLLLRDNISKIADPNKWQSIGGYVEHGESFDTAIRREIKEETNLAPSNIKYYGKLIGKDYVTGFYVSYLSDKEVKEVKLGNEGQKLKFFTVDEMEKLDLTPSVRIYFEKYLPQMEKLIKGEVVSINELGLEP